MSAWVLIVVFVLNADAAPAPLAVGFTSSETCHAAASAIQQDVRARRDDGRLNPPVIKMLGCFKR